MDSDSDSIGPQPHAGDVGAGQSKDLLAETASDMETDNLSKMVSFGDISSSGDLHNALTAQIGGDGIEAVERHGDQVATPLYTIGKLVVVVYGE